VQKSYHSGSSSGDNFFRTRAILITAAKEPLVVDLPVSGKVRGLSERCLVINDLRLRRSERSKVTLSSSST